MSDNINPADQLLNFANDNVRQNQLELQQNVSNPAIGFAGNPGHGDVGRLV